MTSFYGGGAASTSGGGESSAKGALIFKGTLGISDDGATVLALPDTHEEGWTYLVVTAGTYAGQLCEKGDFVICVSSGEFASDLDWTVVQGNIFGPTLPTITAEDTGKAVTIKQDGTGYEYTGPYALANIQNGIENISNYLTYNFEFEKFTDFKIFLKKCIEDGIEKDAVNFECAISSYIPVIPHEIIGANYRGSSENKYYGVNFYDSSKKFIGFIEKNFPTSSYNISYKSQVEIPENCFYVRFQWVYFTESESIAVYKMSPKTVAIPSLSLLQLLVNSAFKIDTGEYVKDTSISVFDNAYLSSEGKQISNSGWQCTDYIDVYKFSMVYISNGEPLYGNPSVCFYDKFKNFIGSIAAANSKKKYTLDEIFSAAKDTRYVRVSSIGEVLVETVGNSKVNEVFNQISEQIKELQDNSDLMNSTIEDLNQNKTFIKNFTEVTSLLGVEHGYIDISGQEFSLDSCYRTGFIPLEDYEKVWFSGVWNQSGASAYAFYNESKKFIDSVESTFGGSVQLYELDFKNFLSENPQRKYIKIVSYFAEMHISAYTKAIINDEVISLGNVLYGKKYVSCGDSFTAGDFSGGEYPKEEYYDSTRQTWKTYPYFIAKRNNMFLINEAKSGSTMYNNGDPNAFSLKRYKEIPTDADYITLQFGLNDVSAPIGTIDDTDNTTEMGAWNVVLKYLIENHPYAKIGIIISDSWLSSELRAAIIQCAEAWGIPYLDMRGSTQVPLGIGGKLGVSIKPDAENARNAAFQVSAENGHPNPKAHEYRSTFIENFMRSL